MKLKQVLMLVDAVVSGTLRTAGMAVITSAKEADKLCSTGKATYDLDIDDSNSKKNDYF